MRVNFKICASLKRGIDLSSLPLDHKLRLIAKASSHCLNGLRGILWVSSRGCGESWYESTRLSF